MQSVGGFHRRANLLEIRIKRSLLGRWICPLACNMSFPPKMIVGDYG